MVAPLRDVAAYPAVVAVPVPELLEFDPELELELELEPESELELDELDPVSVPVSVSVSVSVSVPVPVLDVPSPSPVHNPVSRLQVASAPQHVASEVHQSATCPAPTHSGRQVNASGGGGSGSARSRGATQFPVSQGVHPCSVQHPCAGPVVVGGGPVVVATAVSLVLGGGGGGMPSVS